MLMTFTVNIGLEDWKAKWLQGQLDYSKLNYWNESFLTVKLKLEKRDILKRQISEDIPPAEKQSPQKSLDHNKKALQLTRCI